MSLFCSIGKNTYTTVFCRQLANLKARMRHLETTRSKTTGHVIRRGIRSSNFGSRRQNGLENGRVCARRNNIAT